MHQLRQRKGFRHGLLFPGLESSKLKQLVHQTAQASALLEGNVEKAVLLFRGQPVTPELEAFDIALHRGQRRTQVMGHLGHQLPALGVFFRQQFDLGRNAAGHVIKGGTQVVNFVAHHWPPAPPGAL